MLLLTLADIIQFMYNFSETFLIITFKITTQQNMKLQ